MVGLTGGIGSGKSAVAAELAALGAVVIDADRIAREVVAPGTDGLTEVITAFGPQVLTVDGSLDRAVLASTVFGDDTARRRLEAIIHPRVRARTAALATEAPGDAIVVNDVPLLVESGLGATYHLVVVVQATEEVRIERLTRERGMPEAEVRARIRAQVDDTQRAAAADVVLPNDGTLEELAQRVRALWTDRMRPFEENIRLRRAQPGPGELVIAAPDPSWPVQYGRLAARLARAAGPIAQRIDHVGSTSVPDLPAQNVIDIQVTVASLADADVIADALGAVGFPRLAGQRTDNPKASEWTAPAELAKHAMAEPRMPRHAEPANGARHAAPVEPEPLEPGWRKRMHASADPGRRANIHLRVAGSPNWRYALLMRDFLRAGPAARQEYATLKARLAASGLTRAAYLEAKEPWFDAMWPRMQAWAREAGWTPPPVG